MCRPNLLLIETYGERLFLSFAMLQTRSPLLFTGPVTDVHMPWSSLTEILSYIQNSIEVKPMKMTVPQTVNDNLVECPPSSSSSHIHTHSHRPLDLTCPHLVEKEQRVEFDNSVKSLRETLVTLSSKWEVFVKGRRVSPLTWSRFS